MYKLLAYLTLGVLFAASLHASENNAPLVINMSDPNVRITVPGMDGIEMDLHPMNGQKPVFRLRGSSGKTSISVITPKINKEVSP